ncbi:MAG: ribonuclease HII [Deltaproteobacteria bacterium]|nr:ribonuclease HII [Deltaproteobacteria bacterium]
MNPKWTYEAQCYAEGYECIAGVDEVGMGCLAGPVVAAAVILNPKDLIDGIDDSKKLTPKKREFLSEEIKKRALSYSIAQASVDEIDSINIYHAAKLAMKRAIEGLQISPDFVLMDGRGTLEIATPHLAIVKGDSHSLSIGAASIIAKVTRDSWMEDYDLKIPGYGFAKHKGYGSVFHRQCLTQKGPSSIHRKSFSWSPV